MKQNYALIFAGGTGQRMNTKAKPKQFLELHGKAIIIHTLLNFETNDNIDGIVVVCLESWIPYLRNLIERESLIKVKSIVSGGSTGQESILKGLQEIANLVDDRKDTLAIISDGVRPVVSQSIINNCIESANLFGSAAVVTPVTETILIVENNEVKEIPDRSKCVLSKAPQCFILEELLQAHKFAINNNILNCTNSAELMMKYGKKIHTIIDGPDNIKITTPVDFYIYRAIMDSKENEQVFGL